MKIILDSDPNLNYETNGAFRNMIDFVFVPVLNNLPKFFQKLIKKTHKSADSVIKEAATFKALEVLYSHGYIYKSKNPLQRLFRGIWFTRNNAKAVRNRLQLVKREIKKVALDVFENTGYINLLSIASGSARAVIESFIRTEMPNDASIFLSFLDKSPVALEYSKELAKVLPENFNIRWIEDTASNFPNYFINKKPNIIEMVGLLDYFDDEKVEKIFKVIYENLENGGTFITANIVDNKERKFVTNIIGWKMIYRKPETIFKLASKAGFKDENITIYYEPFKIHFVMVVKK